ncbi:putative converts proline to delta-1-pyrroline-5-carboxylate [Lyophyllum shimeji]|uniref:Proline dehydrogenase n=1 Tax=Lyophyllum shimeji TaxID=47721 RepID=A0A9P3UKV1_LYOSH|nr:putative converts proline to delta-1-pyrroline-5-carboxylate [Lyophyllum shimeji]
MLRIPRILTKPSFLQALRPASRPSLGRTFVPRAQWRNASTSTGGTASTRRKFGFLSGGALLALGLSPFYASHIHADAVAPDETEDLSLGALIRTYVVYTMCSIPTLVDNSPKLMQLATLPGIRWFAETFVRITFFDQFVGGDTAQNTLPLLYKLRATNKGALFAYSVEVDEAEATASSSKGTQAERSPYKRIVDEMVHCVDVAADFEDRISGKVHTGRKTWVAVKLSALLPDAEVLIKLSSHLLTTRPRLPIAFPGCPHSTDLDVLDKPPVEPSQRPGALTAEDIAALRELHVDLVRICTRAQQRGVKIIIDAEYSWYQPAIDALTLSLTRQFNKLPSRSNPDASHVQPLVYGTYQAYLRRTPEHLAQSLADAKAGNYALGVKLVRGAYHPHELAAHAAGLAHNPSLSISPDAQPPVWSMKPETDACYNECLRVLINAIREDVDTRRPRGLPQTPAVAALFGTHNWESCELLLQELVKTGLAFKGPEEGSLVLLPDDVTERVTIGQLYGMHDDLTNHLVNTTASNTPLIIKYVPYGALSEVMPYLSRRAIENKSVLGEGMAGRERRRAAAEIKRRLFGSWFAMN